MFRLIHRYLALRPVMSGLVVVAMWSNASTWVFCPHMSGSSKHCFTLAPSLSQKHDRDTAIEHGYCSDMQISVRDTQDMTMDKSVEIENLTEGAATPQSESDAILKTELTGVELTTAEVIVGPTESCLHCMMHSQSSANVSLRANVLNNPRSQSVANHSSLVTTVLPSVVSIVDLHDHGPPGLNGSRYILNAAFRI